jgi:hypothetical protein
LNIVVDESRILASRERCPFLVHLEVAETGLRGNDSRLYASGASRIGATIEEALGLSAKASAAAASVDATHGGSGYGNYHIPSELLASSPPILRRKSSDADAILTGESSSPSGQADMPRGGWQADEAAFYSHNLDDVFASNPYDVVREDEYQQLHEQMYQEYGTVDQPQIAPENR